MVMLATAAAVILAAFLPTIDGRNHTYAFESFFRSIASDFSDAAQTSFINLIKLSEGHKNKVFVACPYDTRPRSQCYSSTTRRFLSSIQDKMNDIGCIPPSNGVVEMIQGITDKFGEPAKIKIISRRAEQCGSTCTYRLGCCSVRSEFYFEGSRSAPCDRNACEIDELSLDEQSELGVEGGECDLASAGFPDWDTIRYMTRILTVALQRVHERLMCNIFSSKNPRLNCIKGAKGKCVCCCHNMRPEHGRCVEINKNECPYPAI